MPVHAAAPTDLTGLVDAWEGTVNAVLELAITTPDRDEDRPTDCPGWSVKDQVAHVVGLEAYLGGGVIPDVELPDLPHLTTKLSRVIERPIQARRSQPLADTVEELRWVIRQRLSQLRDPELTLDTLVRGPFGEAPLGEVLRMRILDVWTHEQDIRHALGRPGDLDTPAAAVVVDQILSLLPRIVAKTAQVPVGQRVVVEVTGPRTAREGVRVVEGEGGKPLGVPLFTGADTGVIPVIRLEDLEGQSAAPHGEEPEPEPTTSIALTTDALARRATGRRTVEETPHSLIGDPEIGRRVLEALQIISI